MAVRASNVALVDLKLDRRPTPRRGRDGSSNIELLVYAVAVVELKNDGITFAAVDAGILKEKRP